MVAASLLGLTAQCIKICVDILVQAHVADEFKGRVFVLYDMIFNVTLVVAAVIGAVILPANGKSVIILVVMAVCYLLIGLRARQPWREHERGHRVAPGCSLALPRAHERLTHRELVRVFAETLAGPDSCDLGHVGIIEFEIKQLDVLPHPSGLY
jgi:MFS family permease